MRRKIENTTLRAMDLERKWNEEVPVKNVENFENEYAMDFGSNGMDHVQWNGSW